MPVNAAAVLTALHSAFKFGQDTADSTDSTAGTGATGATGAATKTAGKPPG